MIMAINQMRLSVNPTNCLRLILYKLGNNGAEL